MGDTPKLFGGSSEEKRKLGVGRCEGQTEVGKARNGLLGDGEGHIGRCQQENRLRRMFSISMLLWSRPKPGEKMAGD